jgi:hypothetical protein
MHHPDPERGERRAAEPLGMRVGVRDRLAGDCVRMLVSVRMGVLNRAVAVGMHVEIAPVPPDQETNREGHDDNPDSSLSSPLDRLRQVATEEYDRKSEGKQCGCVAQPPGETQHGSSTGAIASVT